MSRDLCVEYFAGEGVMTAFWRQACVRVVAVEKLAKKLRCVEGDNVEKVHGDNASLIHLSHYAEVVDCDAYGMTLPLIKKVLAESKTEKKLVFFTDGRLVRDTVKFLSNIEGKYYGRAAWHVIGGLPTERPEEVLHLHKVVREIDANMRSSKRRNLALHWQPFQPLPGTPMQWFGCGGGVRRLAATFKDLNALPNLRVTQLTGRTDYMAAATTILSRATPAGGAAVLEAMAHGKPSLDELRSMAESHEHALQPDEPLPWDFIDYAYDKTVVRKAYDVICRKLAEVDPAVWRSMDSEAKAAALPPLAGSAQKPRSDAKSGNTKTIDLKEYGLSLAAIRAKELINKHRRSL